jgi:hypothetical protein
VAICRGSIERKSTGVELGGGFGGPPGGGGPREVVLPRMKVKAAPNREEDLVRIVYRKALFSAMDVEKAGMVSRVFFLNHRKVV